METASSSTACSLSDLGKRKRCDRGDEAPVFVQTLFALMSDADKSIVRWSEDGSKMVIADPARFAAEVCPAYFRHRNFSSFTRLLNMYQFHKVPGSSRESKVVRFAHAHFREGKPEEAMVKYGEAIAAFQREGLHEGMAVCLVNRSIVNAKLSRWPESYCDAKLACSLFPRFFKARAARGRRARSRAPKSTSTSRRPRRSSSTAPRSGSGRSSGSRRRSRTSSAFAWTSIRGRRPRRWEGGACEEGESGARKSKIKHQTYYCMHNK